MARGMRVRRERMDVDVDVELWQHVQGGVYVYVDNPWRKTA